MANDCCQLLFKSLSAEAPLKCSTVSNAKKHSIPGTRQETNHHLPLYIGWPVEKNC